MNHIVIIGFMGSGKTRVGKRLAKDLGLPFIDVDRLIVKKMNMSVKEVFERFGELDCLCRSRTRNIFRIWGRSSI